jgi:hypothetical protein
MLTKGIHIIHLKNKFVNYANNTIGSIQEIGIEFLSGYLIALNEKETKKLKDL